MNLHNIIKDLSIDVNYNILNLKDPKNCGESLALSQALENLSGEVLAAVMSALDENHFVKLEVKMREVVLMSDGKVETYDLADVDPSDAELCWLKVQLRLHFTRPISEREVKRAQRLLEMIFDYPKVWREKNVIVVEIPVENCVDGLMDMYNDLASLLF